MILEVTGTSTRNKGAELMLATIAGHFENRPDIQLAVSPGCGPYARRAKYGLLQKVRLERFGRSRAAFALMPGSFRDACGMVGEGRIDAILDASGFAFGDQLPVETACRFAASCERWKTQGKRIVLLPQALGPFEDPTARRAFRTIASNADLIFARDTESFSHACEIAEAEGDKIRIAPDITVEIQPSGAPTGQVDDGVAMIVPNVRMLDRTRADQSGAYLPFLVRCARACEANGLTPVILLHDDVEDQALVAPLFKELGQALPVVQEPDPVRLKRLLGEAYLVIGSRFHALVGALSNGVPAIAAGWSHKYHRLFADFGCSDMVVGVDESARGMEGRVSTIAAERSCRAERLRSRTDRMRGALSQLWTDVEACLFR